MSMNPLDWPAEPFLTFYVMLTVLAAAILILLRHEATVVKTADLGPLSPLELAILSGGIGRAADTALVAMLVADGARLAPKGKTISFHTTAVPLSAEIEALRRNVSGDMTRMQFHKAVTPQLAAINADLAGRGLTPPAHALQRLRKYTLCVLAIPILVGIAKMIVGASRGRPIGILAVLVVATGMLGIVLLSRMPRRTEAGREALETHRDRHARAARAPLDTELSLAFALTGVAVLAGTPFAPLAAQIRSDGGGGDGGGGCGGGGGGGGCGGCSS
jgi:uncharacterized protein (TIGR04222 family)